MILIMRISSKYVHTIPIVFVCNKRIYMYAIISFEQIRFILTLVSLMSLKQSHNVPVDFSDCDA